MDERPPRQPDSSEPPEDSADTGAEARPPNPYRIPQRPPESEREETGGFSYERPAQKDEDPATDTWDNPFRSGAAAEAESGPDTPWGAPVPGDGSSTGTSSAETMGSEDSWDTGTPWGAPVPGEEPRTSAFGSVGAPEETPGSDAGQGDDASDEHDADDTWASPASDTSRSTGLPGSGSGSGWGADTHDDHGSSDAWDSQGASNSWVSGAMDDSRGASEAWGSDRGAHDAGSARGESDAGNTWDIGTTGDSRGTGDAWSADSGSWGADRAAGSGPYDEHGSRDTWGTSGAEQSAWGTGPGDSWGTSSGDAWATPTSDTSQGAGAPGWGSTAPDDQYSGWGAPSGATGAWGSSESSDTHDNAANTWGSEPAGAGHTWSSEARDDRGAADTWGTPGPDTAAFGSVGHPDDEYQYGAAHGDGWGAWGNENDESWGSGPNAARGAGAAGAAGAAAWGASPYGESGGTEFYGDAHGGGQDWDDPYHGQPAYQGDTPYPGGPVQPPASEGYEYLYGGGRGGGHDGYDADHGAAPDPDGEPRGKSRKGLIIGASSVLVLALVGGAIGWYVWQMPEPEEATAAFASSWEAQDYEALAETTRGDDAAEILGGIDAGLGVDSIDVDVGQPSVESGEGSASYEVTVSLTNADDWGWEGELPLLREDGEWWIDFSPEVAYPGLGEGEVLARTAVWGERGHILAADGSRLDTPESSGSLQMIAGSLGEADEDDIERLGPAYDAGDTIGVDGLQRTHEEHLAGEAATTIVMADAEEAQGEGSVEATEENTVATLDGSDGEDITTSIDPNVQSTAASAIMEADDPAGLVALRPSSGEILAAVNVPGGFNRAFEGQYPPGSAFKIVSYSALLDSGMSTDATMDCPKEYELGGWPFRNAGEAEYGSQSVTEAFATSCNTALVSELGDRVSGEQLQASAEQFGMNQPLDIGVTTHEPVFPAVDSATMLGSQGIGQGQILTSPLHMATLPAAIADGSWRHPVLVNEPEPADLPEPTQIANAEAIRPMMRAVITDGTAEDLGFQGEVFGKTGTAEFGTAEDADEDEELPSHAWMIGYKGDVAFAVVVDGGGGGSSVAGPLAESFANGLP